MNAKIQIIEALQTHLRAGNPEPSTLKISMWKAQDLCRLGRDDLGDLSGELSRYGPQHLETTGFLGLKVVLTTSGPDIAFE